MRTLQSIISRALDDDNYVAMASIDLSAAFDIVNVDLLIKRLRRVGACTELLPVFASCLVLLFVQLITNKYAAS